MFLYSFGLVCWGDIVLTIAVVAVVRYGASSSVVACGPTSAVYVISGLPVFSASTVVVFWAFVAGCCAAVSVAMTSRPFPAFFRSMMMFLVLVVSVLLMKISCSGQWNVPCPYSFSIHYCRPGICLWGVSINTCHICLPVHIWQPHGMDEAVTIAAVVVVSSAWPFSLDFRYCSHLALRVLQ